MIATVSNKCKTCRDCDPVSSAINSGTYTDDFSTLTFSPPNNNLADWPNTWLKYGNQFTGWEFYGLPANQLPFTPNSWPTYVDTATNKAVSKTGYFGRFRPGYLQGTTFVSMRATVTWDTGTAYPANVGAWVVANGQPVASGSCGIRIFPGEYYRTNIGSSSTTINQVPEQGDILKVTLTKVSETAGAQSFTYQSTCDIYLNGSLVRTGTFEHYGIYNGTETDLDSSACAFVGSYGSTQGTDLSKQFYIDDLEIVAT